MVDPQNLAMATALATMESVPGLAQRPVYNAADFVARPVVNTWLLPVAATLPGVWGTALVVETPVGKINAFNRYVATTLGAIPAGLLMRITLIGRDLSDVLIGPGDRCKVGPTTYPVIWQDFFQTILERQKLAIQYQFAGPGTVTLLLGFSGWQYFVKDSAEPSSSLTGRSEDTR
jgi:hypothetical protein